MLASWPVSSENLVIKLPAQYRFGDTATAVLFTPANLNRLIRPSRWRTRANNLDDLMVFDSQIR
jgi:hypothetical protein